MKLVSGILISDSTEQCTSSDQHIHLPFTEVKETGEGWKILISLVRTNPIKIKGFMWPSVHANLPILFKRELCFSRLSGESKELLDSPSVTFSDSFALYSSK